MTPKDLDHLKYVTNDKVQDLINEIGRLNEDNQNLRDVIADLNTELAVCQATIDMLRGNEEP